jgi:ribosomal protein L32
MSTWHIQRPKILFCFQKEKRIMEVAIVSGILLWSLIPGFIAMAKGRSFWFYFLISLIISPLISTIIIICLSTIPEREAPRPQSKPSIFQDTLQEKQCPTCGKLQMANRETCAFCGTSLIYVPIFIPASKDSPAKPAPKIISCPHCGKTQTSNRTNCYSCGADLTTMITDSEESGLF